MLRQYKKREREMEDSGALLIYSLPWLPHLDKRVVYHAPARRASLRRPSIGRRGSVTFEVAEDVEERERRRRRRRNLLFTSSTSHHDRMSHSFSLHPLMPLEDGLAKKEGNSNNHLTAGHHQVVFEHDARPPTYAYRLVRGVHKEKSIFESDEMRRKRMIAEAEAEAQTSLLRQMEEGIIRGLLHDMLRHKSMRHGARVYSILQRKELHKKRERQLRGLRVSTWDKEKKMFGDRDVTREGRVEEMKHIEEVEVEEIVMPAAEKAMTDEQIAAYWQSKLPFFRGLLTEEEVEFLVHNVYALLNKQFIINIKAVKGKGR
eukprot:CAMPEP_0113901668 /NCGR_PEP_ID=MMETSP0780_2-20120614/21386_1 /TAXON_ID=652834 /ORGANISM="Palpitomonas bilix" /LENGTH=316 /DNA_ID=CAMNT_0000894315 /DNA_START=190 /DNA_END=1140 /DNA_ORIENTATION=- /assembly_acc=CAM_ASM_000599